MDTTTQDLVALTSGIVNTYHEPLRRDIPYIREEIKILWDVGGKRNPSLSDVEELFEQFAKQVIKHMKREEEEFFPVLCEVEECYSGKKKYKKCDLERFDTTIRKLEQDHEEFDTYVYDMVDVFKNIQIDKIDKSIYDRCKRIFATLEIDVMHHTQAENMKLHVIAREKYNVLCG